MSSISRPPTKIGDLLFHEKKNDNADAVSCLGAKSLFIFKWFRWGGKKTTHISFR